MTAAFQRALDLWPAPTDWKLYTSEELASRTRIRAGLTEDNWPLKVWGFRKVMERELPTTPRELTPLEKQLHASLIYEEASEFAAAPDFINQADGLLDIIYVAVGALLHMGFAPQIINLLMEEIHASNMTKVMDNCKPLINDGVIDPSQPIGKVLKTSNYAKPDLRAVLASYRGDDLFREQVKASTEGLDNIAKLSKE